MVTTNIFELDLSHAFDETCQCVVECACDPACGTCSVHCEDAGAVHSIPPARPSLRSVQR